uniref:Uncharacterized protein n=1 Tax=Rhodococcus sp. NS1 TaxID=402236 RepID=A0A097SQH8_9NOCA|nr:hypothetical protein LRS1606.338 [Rhodococcus sp. NS1]
MKNPAASTATPESAASRPARTARASPTSSGEGVNTRRTGSSCAGWIHARPTNPSRASARVSASNASPSRKLRETAAGGGSMPAATLAATTWLRANSSAVPSSSTSTPRSAARSTSPSCRNRIRGARAMASASNTPAAVSINADIAAPGQRSASRRSTCSTSCAEPTFGNHTPVSRGCATARISSSCKTPGFTRTHTSTEPGASVATHRATVSRAKSLRSAATASSRSSTIASAPEASALSKRSGRSPGTYR